MATSEKEEFNVKVRSQTRTREQRAVEEAEMVRERLYSKPVVPKVSQSEYTREQLLMDAQRSRVTRENTRSAFQQFKQAQQQTIYNTSPAPVVREPSSTAFSQAFRQFKSDQESQFQSTPFGAAPVSAPVVAPVRPSYNFSNIGQSTQSVLDSIMTRQAQQAMLRRQNIENPQPRTRPVTTNPRLARTNEAVQQNANIMDNLRGLQERFENAYNNSTGTMKIYNDVNKNIAKRLYDNLSQSPREFAQQLAQQITNVQVSDQELASTEKARDTEIKILEIETKSLQTYNTELNNIRAEMKNLEGQPTEVARSELSKLQSRTQQIVDRINESQREITKTKTEINRLADAMEYWKNKKELASKTAQYMSAQSTLDLATKYKDLLQIEKRLALTQLEEKRDALRDKLNTQANRDLYAGYVANIRILRDAPNSVFKSESESAFLLATVQQLVLDNVELQQDAQEQLKVATSVSTLQYQQWVDSSALKDSQIAALNNQIKTLSEQLSETNRANGTSIVAAAEQLSKSTQRVESLERQVAELNRQIGQMGTPEEMQRAQTLLASTQASYTTLYQAMQKLATLPTSGDVTKTIQEVADAFARDQNPEVQSLAKVLHNSATSFTNNYQAAINTATQVLDSEVKRQAQEIKRLNDLIGTAPDTSASQAQINQLQQQLNAGVTQLFQDINVWNQATAWLDADKMATIIQRFGAVARPQDLQQLGQAFDQAKDLQIQQKTERIRELNEQNQLLQEQSQNLVHEKTTLDNTWKAVFKGLGVDNVDPAAASVIVANLRKAEPTLTNLSNAVASVFGVGSVTGRTEESIKAELDSIKSNLTKATASTIRAELEAATMTIRNKEKLISEKDAALGAANGTISSLRKQIEEATGKQSQAVAAAQQNIESIINSALPGADSNTLATKIGELREQIRISQQNAVDQQRQNEERIQRMVDDYAAASAEKKAEFDAHIRRLEETYAEAEGLLKSKSAVTEKQRDMKLNQLQTELNEQKETTEITRKQLVAESEKTRKLEQEKMGFEKEKEALRTQFYSKLGTTRETINGKLTNVTESNLLFEAARDKLIGMANAFTAHKLLNRLGNVWSVSADAKKNMSNKIIRNEIVRLYVNTWMEYFSYEDNSVFLMKGADVTNFDLSQELTENQKTKLTLIRLRFLSQRVNRLINNPSAELDDLLSMMTGKASNTMKYFNDKTEYFDVRENDAGATPDKRKQYLDQFRNLAITDSTRALDLGNINGLSLISTAFTSDKGIEFFAKQVPRIDLNFVQVK